MLDTGLGFPFPIIATTLLHQHVVRIIYLYVISIFLIKEMGGTGFPLSLLVLVH